MRILIVGAGIAGLTLAALLRMRGLRPTIIEKAPAPPSSGHFIGLYPSGSRVLYGLGLFDLFLQRSADLDEYGIFSDSGREVALFDLAQEKERYGPIRITSRDRLLSIFDEQTSDLGIRYGVTLTSLVQSRSEVVASFSEGVVPTAYDLVVGCDGIGSITRQLLGIKANFHELPWRSYTWWVDENLVGAGKAYDFFGLKRLIGLYAVEARTAVFAALPNSGQQAAAACEQNGKAGLLTKAFARMAPQVSAATASLSSPNCELRQHKLQDCSSRQWSQGRVVLMGDAAASFLVINGPGASMAMESAAVLNDELSRVDAQYVERAIAMFKMRRMARVAKVQREARLLTKLACLKSPSAHFLRNSILHRIRGVDILAKNIFSGVAKPI